MDQASTNECVQSGAWDFERVEGLYWDLASGSGESVDDSSLVRVQFAFGGREYGDLDGALGLLLGGEVFAGDPLLADHAVEESAGCSCGGAEGLFSDE